MGTKLTVLCLLAASAAAGQSIGAGIKGGIPLTNVFKASGLIGSEPFRASTQRFTIGPMFELRLPFGLGAEFDILYKRIDQTGGSVRPGQTVSGTATSWEFPVLGKYRFAPGPVSPYIEGGVSVHRLSGYLRQFRTLPDPPSSQPEGELSRRGVVLGAGFELKLPLLRISPGLRFSHWGAHEDVPGTNALDFLVGVTF